jgi:predicted GNAT family acetyltransferase
MPFNLMLCEQTFTRAVLYAVRRAVAGRASLERYGMGKRSVNLRVTLVDDVTRGSGPFDAQIAEQSLNGCRMYVTKWEGDR